MPRGVVGVGVSLDLGLLLLVLLIDLVLFGAVPVSDAFGACWEGEHGACKGGEEEGGEGGGLA